MIVLRRQCALRNTGNPSRREPDTHLAVLFGVGMIGHAVLNGLYRFGYERHAEIVYPWDDRDGRIRAGRGIEQVCRDAPGSRKPLVSVIWSAGTAGFHSSAEALNPERSAFEDTVALATQLCHRLDAAPLDFHFVSSAGGLFEGQEVVGPSSPVAPMRPYGEMKRDQEQLLARRLSGQMLSIYRPSSIYGPWFRGSRHGLINHLVRNGRRGRVTVLDAHVMALRDYVYSGDIGTFIARRIRYAEPDSGRQQTHFLVSSRCASIFEVVGKIERVLNMKLAIRFDENFGNHRNITFSERILPHGWRPSPLEVGIRQFLVQPGPGSSESQYARSG